MQALTGTATEEILSVSEKGLELGRCLIIAHNIGGTQLNNFVRSRLERSSSQFFIVVPVSAPKHETSSWGALPFDGVPPPSPDAVFEEEVQRRKFALDEARRLAERRLVRMIDRIRSAGGEVCGAVRDATPAAAARAALARDSYDEIVVSVLPSRGSRWFRLDLARRIARVSELPITTIDSHVNHTHDSCEHRRVKPQPRGEATPPTKPAWDDFQVDEE